MPRDGDRDSLSAAIGRLRSAGCTDMANLGPALDGLTTINSTTDHLVTNGPYRFVAVDDRAFRDNVLLASSIVQIAATGTPVVSTADFANPWLYGSTLASTLRTRPEADADIDWALLGARQKTICWTEHIAELAWESTGPRWSPRVRRLPLPSVTVMLSTKRPAMLDESLGMLARQEGVPVQARIALHGGSDTDLDTVKSALRNHRLEGSVEIVPVDVPFGAVLNLLAGTAEGTWLAKWDDDDLYGPRHLKDLIAASRHSGAPLIGKAAEFTYFRNEDVTTYRNSEGSESVSIVVAGGALLIDVNAFRSSGGFPPTSRFVDHYLKQRFLLKGLEVFRTHGFGFVLVRHGDRHTWEMDESAYRASTLTQWLGIPAVADI
jgi:hypothetical protein